MSCTCYKVCMLSAWGRTGCRCCLKLVDVVSSAMQQQARFSTTAVTFAFCLVKSRGGGCSFFVAVPIPCVASRILFVFPSSRMFAAKDAFFKGGWVVSLLPSHLFIPCTFSLFTRRCSLPGVCSGCAKLPLFAFLSFSSARHVVFSPLIGAPDSVLYFFVSMFHTGWSHRLPLAAARRSVVSVVMLPMTMRRPWCLDEW